ncbi:hypothetical protein M0802_011375 [Mischocyttarus mexicanus]|nr:hypothetical protein M0802_011375 [Mischocyttarus mexicanus]
MQKNKNSIVYPNVNSVTRPISHGPEIPLPPLPFSISDLSPLPSSEPSIKRQKSKDNFESDKNQSRRRKNDDDDYEDDNDNDNDNDDKDYNDDASTPAL